MVRADIADAAIVDDGYASFEVVGEQNYLGEKAHTPMIWQKRLS